MINTYGAEIRKSVAENGRVSIVLGNLSTFSHDYAKAKTDGAALAAMQLVTDVNLENKKAELAFVSDALSYKRVNPDLLRGAENPGGRGTYRVNWVQLLEERIENGLSVFVRTIDENKGQYFIVFDEAVGELFTEQLARATNEKVRESQTAYYGDGQWDRLSAKNLERLIKNVHSKRKAFNVKKSTDAHKKDGARAIRILMALVDPTDGINVGKVGKKGVTATRKGPKKDPNYVEFFVNFHKRSDDRTLDSWNTASLDITKINYSKTNGLSGLKSSDLFGFGRKIMRNGAKGADYERSLTEHANTYRGVVLRGRGPTPVIVVKISDWWNAINGSQTESEKKKGEKAPLLLDGKNAKERYAQYKKILNEYKNVVIDRLEQTGDEQAVNDAREAFTSAVDMIENLWKTQKAMFASSEDRLSSRDVASKTRETVKASSKGRKGGSSR